MGWFAGSFGIGILIHVFFAKISNSVLEQNNFKSSSGLPRSIESGSSKALATCVEKLDSGGVKSGCEFSDGV